LGSAARARQENTDAGVALALRRASTRAGLSNEVIEVQTQHNGRRIGLVGVGKQGSKLAPTR
jgi:phosphoglycerate dehydrogenase-like enzyme